MMTKQDLIILNGIKDFVKVESKIERFINILEMILMINEKTIFRKFGIFLKV